MVGLLALGLLSACGGGTKITDPCELTQNAISQTANAVGKSESAVQTLDKSVHTERGSRASPYDSKNAIGRARDAQHAAQGAVKTAFQTAPDCSPEATHALADAQNLLAQNRGTNDIARKAYDQATYYTGDTTIQNADGTTTTISGDDVWVSDSKLGAAKESLKAAQASLQRALTELDALKQTAANIPNSTTGNK